MSRGQCGALSQQPPDVNVPSSSSPNEGGDSREMGLEARKGVLREVPGACDLLQAKGQVTEIPRGGRSSLKRGQPWLGSDTPKFEVRICADARGEDRATLTDGPPGRLL